MLESGHAQRVDVVEVTRDRRRVLICDIGELFCLNTGHNTVPTIDELILALDPNATGQRQGLAA